MSCKHCAYLIELDAEEYCDSSGQKTKDIDNCETIY